MSRLAAAASDILGPARSVAFRRLLIARSISSLGNAGTRVALVWYVVHRLDRPAWLGLVLIANTVPQFFVGLIGGAVADRFSRKTIVVAAYLVSSAMLVTLWLLPGTPSLLMLGGLVAVVGACAAILEPAMWALIPHLVQEGTLRPASTLRTVADQLTQILGPAAAGITVAALGPQAWFALDAATFVAAAATFAAIPTPAGSSRADRKQRQWSIVSDLVTAARTIAGSRWLRTGVLAGGLANLLLVAPIGVALPLIINQHGLGPATLGWFGTLLGIGTVLGALAANWLTKSRPVELALVMLAGSGVAVALIGLLPTTPAILIFGFTLGVLLSVFEVIWNAYELANLDDAMLAKVLAGDQWLSFALRTLGLAGLVSLGTWSPTITVISCGAALTVLMLTLTARFAIRPRTLDQPL